jgi:hypothetical protein
MLEFATGKSYQERVVSASGLLKESIPSGIELAMPVSLREFKTEPRSSPRIDPRGEGG